MRRNRIHEAGEGKLQAVVWLIILILIGMIAYEAIPVRIRMAELEDFMMSTTSRARFRNQDPIKKSILAKAQELDLPLSSDHLSVRIANERIQIRARYTVPLEFPFYTYQWEKTHDIDRPIFYF